MLPAKEVKVVVVDLMPMIYSSNSSEVAVAEAIAMEVVNSISSSTLEVGDLEVDRGDINSNSSNSNMKHSLTTQM
jgi:hypothetical protein